MTTDTKKSNASIGAPYSPSDRNSFVKVPTAVVRDASLSDAAKVLYAEILTYAWESIGSDCTASQATLATDLGWSVDKVQRVAKECQARGLIACERTGRTNHYRPRYRTDAASDTALMRYQIPHPRGTNQTKGTRRTETPLAHNGSDKTKGSSSPCGRPATTTNDLLVSDASTKQAVADLAANLLQGYDDAVEAKTGTRPSRRKGDKPAARELAAELVANGHDETEFERKIDHGLTDGDKFTQKRLLNCFAAATKVAPSLSVPAEDADTHSDVECWRCNKDHYDGDKVCKACSDYITQETGYGTQAAAS